MNRKELEFCELLCAKFCHDLSGPIGAINNGIDFLDSDDESMQKRAAELVKLSSNQAVNRLAFFRQAYGSISNNGEISLHQLKSLLDKFAQDTKMTLELNEVTSKEVHIDQLLAKIILNLVIISANAILLNGTISINFDNPTNIKKVEISAEGPVVKSDEELVSIISNNHTKLPLTTRNIQHFYTSFLIRSLKAKFDIESTKKGLNLTLTTK